MDSRSILFSNNVFLLREVFLVWIEILSRNCTIICDLCFQILVRVKFLIISDVSDYGDRCRLTIDIVIEIENMDFVDSLVREIGADTVVHYIIELNDTDRDGICQSTFGHIIECDICRREAEKSASGSAVDDGSTYGCDACLPNR